MGRLTEASNKAPVLAIYGDPLKSLLKYEMADISPKLGQVNSGSGGGSRRHAGFPGEETGSGLMARPPP
jgi:hypothetical protein